MSESDLHGHPDDALVDLLVKRVIEGLSPAEQRELDLMDSARVSDPLHGLELAAAAATLAGITLEKPPTALLALLERHAEEFFAPGKVVDLPVPLPAPTLPTAATSGAASGGTGSFVTVTPSVPASGTGSRVPGSRRAARRGNWGWFAAAACLVLAVVGWLRSPLMSVAPVATLQPGPPLVAARVTPPVVLPPTPAAERAAMLARADTLKVTLGATKDPAAAGVNGDAVWDPVAQKGFLHFVGLASNDPSVRQYQLWIFDGKRDPRYPVDGGVFDVPADASEVVIPVHAALSVGEVKAFAVTVEKAGGVVVSGRTHVVVLGAVG